MNRNKIILIASLMGLLLIPSTAKVSLAAEDSHIVGRLLGTVHPLPGFFRNNNTLVANNDYPEFLGFRFVNSQSGKKTNMRPDSNGYFSKSLEPGTWVLERFRKDRPSGDAVKVFEIMTFDVPERALVNLGTIRIVLEGEPQETFRIRAGEQKGTYIYTYNYERSGSADDFSWPIDNLKRKQSKIFEEYQSNIVDVNEPVTTQTDSSMIKYRVYD